MGCLGCGGHITAANVSRDNEWFHLVCMDDGIGIDLPPGKYSAAQLEHTWAKEEANADSATA